MGGRASLATQVLEFFVTAAASVLIPMAVFAVFAKGHSSSAQEMLGPYAVWALIYYLPTMIMLKEVELTGPLRYAFSLTIVPLFIFLLLLTIAFAFGSIPALDGVFRNVYGHGRGGMGIAIPLCLVSAGTCWLWYRLLLVLQRVTGRTSQRPD